MTKPRIDVDLAQVERFAAMSDTEREVADYLGISYSTLRRRKAESELFKQALYRGMRMGKTARFNTAIRRLDAQLKIKKAQEECRINSLLSRMGAI